MKFLVIDVGGSAISHATRLVQDGHEVDYYIPWVGPYPRYIHYAPGEGFDGIKKVKDYGRSIDEADIIMVTDVGYGSMTDYLRRHGHTVFGAGSAEVLEFDRAFAKEAMDSLGIKYPATTVVTGVDAALAHMKKVDAPRIIKLNIFRGDSETMRVGGYDDAYAILNWLRGRLGPFSEDFIFLIEEPIDGVMVGWDGFFDGKKFSKPGGFGLEISADVLEKWSDETLFDPLLEKAQPLLERLGYRSALSIEAMYDGKDLHVIDWCCRFAWPLSIMYVDAFENYSDLVIGTAKGNVPEIKVRKPYTALGAVMVTGADQADSAWLPISAGEDTPFRLRRAVRRGNKTYTVPGGENNVATVYGEGDSWQDAFDMVMKRVPEVEVQYGYYEGTFSHSTKDIVEQVKKLGIKF